MKRIISLFLIVAMVSALLVGCSNAGKESTGPETPNTAGGGNLPVLRTGSFPYRVSIGLWYIMQNGLDVENGFKIETVEVTNGSAINEAFGAGLLDIATIGTAAAVNSAAVYDCQILAEISEGAGDLNLFVRADSDIAKATNNNPNYPKLLGSAESLKGKSIIFPVGSLAQIGVAQYLDAFGLTLDDIEIVNMQYGQAYQAFKAGEGDVVAVFAPANYTALNEGYVKAGSLYDMEYEVKNVVIASQKSLDDAAKKEQIKTFLKILFEVNDKIAADDELQKNLLVEYYKEKGSEVDPEMLNYEINESYIMTSEDAKQANVGNSVVVTAERYVEMGILEADKIDVIKGNIDTSIIDELLGR